MGGKEEAAQVLAAKFAVIFPHLDERQRRLVMAAEARALGHGGIRLVARAAGVREATVSLGVGELEAGAEPLGRRQPETQTEWWALGALRPVVKALVNVHLRRRLATLGSALLRAALLCDDEPESQSRRMFSDASSECRAFAATLSRRSLLAVLATFAATVLSIVSPFLLLPHIPLNGRAIGLWVLLVLIVTIIVFGWAPMNVFFHSVRWKKALFNPASDTSGEPISKPAANVNVDVDVYKLERAAFAAAKLPEPHEWEWRAESLVSIIYPAAIVILLLSIVVPWRGATSIVALVGLFYVVRMSFRWHRRVRARQTLWDQANPPKDRSRASGGGSGSRAQHSR
jgi:hypothetical protein